MSGEIGMIVLFMIYLLAVLVGPITLFVWIRGKILGKNYPIRYLIIGILCSIISVILIIGLFNFITRPPSNPWG